MTGSARKQTWSSKSTTAGKLTFTSGTLNAAAARAQTHYGKQACKQADEQTSNRTRRHPIAATSEKESRADDLAILPVVVQAICMITIFFSFACQASVRQ